jgi:hypothetical protein
MKDYLRISIVLLAFFSFEDLFSQSKDSIMAMNRKYKREVGMDFKGFFKGAPGTSLILKIKDTHSRFVSMSFSKYYRFQLRLEGEFNANPFMQRWPEPYGYFERRDPKGGFSISPMLGKERVNFFGRFNIYYGMDFGPYYSHNTFGYFVYIDTTANHISNYQDGFSNQPYKVTNFGFSAIPFYGMKYRLSEHFSLSVESGFTFSFFISKTTYLNSNQFHDLGYFNKNKSKGFNFAMMYLRFLNLSYHF